MSNSTQNTKKAFINLVYFLEKNKEKKVSTILDEVYKMTEAKTQQKTSYSDEKGTVVAVYCYYHKQWELVKDVPYGTKASSTTGLNSMCKIGTSKWTKQNTRVKAIGNTILALLESGDLKPTEISDKKEELEAKAREIDVEDMPVGFKTLEAALESTK